MRILVFTFVLVWSILTARPILLANGSSVTAIQGATLPYLEYEAESALTNGKILGPSRAFGEIAAESSGRKAVQLNAAGDYVRFKALQKANSVVVRYVIPDAPGGGGTQATISLYVNGVFRKKIPFTSKYAWTYGGEANSAENNPARGGAHHFYDESRALVGDIPAGAEVTLKKDPGDDAKYYVIDLIDLEQVGTPGGIPANFLSIINFGAISNDGKDDAAAIQACIHAARAQRKGVWIPAGVFECLSAPLEVSEVTVCGAGMWFSTLHGQNARFNCDGNNCRFYNFAILGETTTRDDSSPDSGFGGHAGTGSVLWNLWVEHAKCGYWVGGKGVPTNGLKIIGSRFRNLFADGVNFCNGTSNSVVQQCHFRNTGDDAIASWSPAKEGGVNTNNAFRSNTIQVPWRANCMAIYGGKDNKIEGNLCADTVEYPGIMVGAEFESHAMAGTTQILRNTLIRCGGLMWGHQQGALKFSTNQADISGFEVKDIQILEPTFAGIEFQGTHRILRANFSDIVISKAGTWGMEVQPGVGGSVSCQGVTVSEAKRGGLKTAFPSSLSWQKGEGNSGW